MKGKTKLVRGVLQSVSSQRLQYKPYNYSIGFPGEYPGSKTVLVEMEIPADAVVDETSETITVSLEGLKAILSVTADAIDALDEAYRNNYRSDK